MRKSSRISTIVIIAVLFIWGGFVFCNSAVAADKEPIKWGSLDCMSGTFGAFGKGNIGGTKLAIKEINESGGILGRPIVHMIEDTEANTEVAARKARKLILKDKVDVLQGAASTSTTALIMKTAGKYKTLHINSEFDSKSILPAKNDYSFTMAPICEETERARILGIKKIFPPAERKRWFIFYPDYSFGRDMRDVYINELKKIIPDAEIVGTLAHPFNETDYSTHIAKILAAKPDIVIPCAWAGDFLNFVKQAKPLGFFQKTKYIASTACMSAIVGLGEELPKDLWVVTEQGNPYLPELASWKNKYYEYLGEWPITEAATTYYDTVYMYKAAVEKAGSTDATKVAKALEGLKYKGIGGTRYVKPNHIIEVDNIVFAQFNYDKDLKQPVVSRMERIPFHDVMYSNDDLIKSGCDWCKGISMQ